MVPRRCHRTGNECGTDTWMIGKPCLCDECRAYLQEHTKMAQELDTSNVKDDCFTNQKSRIADERDIGLSWNGKQDGFRCYLCGYRFEIGDQFRFVFATHMGITNMLVCHECDGPDVLNRWIDRYISAQKKYWWMKES